MPRKLKVYQTSLGFYDLAIAAPSMKAALKAWGASASPELFRQGFAKEAEDKDVIAAAMAQPGVVLRRPVGSNKRFQEHAELPSAESLAQYSRRSEPREKKAKAAKPKKADQPAKRAAADEAERKAAAKANEKAERKAAQAFAKEERKRELKQRKEEAEAERARARRLAAIEKAESALESARREHDERAARIEKEREAIERRAADEEKRWEKVKSRLEAALHKARR